MPTMKDKDLVKLLMQNGWTLKGTAGSRYRLEKDGKLEVVPVRGKGHENRSAHENTEKNKF